MKIVQFEFQTAGYIMLVDVFVGIIPLFDYDYRYCEGKVQNVSKGLIN